MNHDCFPDTRTFEKKDWGTLANFYKDQGGFTYFKSPGSWNKCFDFKLFPQNGFALAKIDFSKKISFKYAVSFDNLSLGSNDNGMIGARLNQFLLQMSSFDFLDPNFVLTDGKTFTGLALPDNVPGS